MKSMMMFATTLLISSMAHAGLYLEPYIGVGTGKSALSATISGLPVDSSDNMKATVNGGKLGYSFLMVAAGLDVQLASVNSDGSTGSSSITDIGVFGRIGLPFINGAIAIFPNSKLPSDSNEFKGSATKLSVGFTGFPIVSINLDYIMWKYTSTNDSTMTLSKFDNTITMLGVSVPFDL